MMQSFLRDYLGPVFEALNYNLFVLGETRITPFGLIYIACLLIVLVFVSNRLKNVLVTRLLARTRLDLGAQQAIGTITRYVILFVGLLIIFQTVGIDLTTLSVLAGAVGIGIGFGLQNIANNFISGLIILIERPIKVGDRIEVDEVNGDVVLIGARSTTVRERQHRDHRSEQQVHFRERRQLEFRWWNGALQSAGLGGLRFGHRFCDRPAAEDR